MKRFRIILILIGLLAVKPGFCNDNSSINLTAFLLEIGKQTELNVYFLKHETDPVFFKSDTLPKFEIESLRKVLEADSFRVSVFQNHVFVLKNKQISPFVAAMLRTDDNEKTTQSQSEITTHGVTASSEYRIYDIGREGVSKDSLATVSGKVRHFKTGDIVQGATIQVLNLGAGAVTDQQGRFNMVLPKGFHELQVSGIGIINTRRQIRVLSSGNLDIETEEEVFEISELTILSSRLNKMRESTMGIERLRVSEIKNIPMAFGETDLMKAVLALPGVTSAGEVSDGFNVRGSSSDQNLILFNHSTIFNSTHLFGLLSVFNPDITEDVELFMSYIPARYGGRIASVLDVKTKNNIPKKLGGSASIGAHTSRIMLQGPVGSKTSFVAGARVSYADWMLRLIPEEKSYSDGSAGFFDFNVSVKHQFNNQNTLSLHHYASKDHFYFDKSERYAYQNANFSAEWRQLISQSLVGKYIVGHDRFQNNIVNDENGYTAFHLSTGITQSFARADFDWYPRHDHTVNFGFSVQSTDLQRGNLEPFGDISLVLAEQLQKERTTEMAMYAGDEWEITSELTINAGLRYSLYQFMGPRTYFAYNPDFMPALNTITDTITATKGAIQHYHGPEFRLSARYLFGNDWSVKAGFNTMRQYIHKVSNATVMSPTDTWKMSDMHIKPQTGIQIAGGIFKNFFNNSLIASMEMYYKTTDNYLDYRSGANLIMNEHIETELVNTDAQAYGIELSLRKPTGKLSGWINYSYSRSVLRQSDPLIINPVNGGDWYPADFDKPHDFKLVSNYKFTHRYSISGNVFYSTGRPITIPIAKYRFSGGEYVYYSERNQHRIPDYFRMDASFNIEPSHHLARLTHSTISLGIYNITGRNNVYSVFFVSENGRIRGKQLSILGAAIPYVSYNIKF